MIGSQSTNLLLLHNQCHPQNFVRVGHKETTIPPLLASLLLFVVSLPVFSSVFVLLLRAVLVDFIDDRRPDATVQPCTCFLGLIRD